MKKISKLFFFLIFLLFPFGQLTRINLTQKIPGLKIQVFDFFVFLFGFFVCLDKETWKNFKIKLFSLFKSPPLFLKYLFVLCFIMCFSLIFNFHRLQFSNFLVAFLYFLRFLNYLWFFFVFTIYLLNNQINIKKIFIYDGIILSFFSILLYVLLPDTRFLFNFGWDKHYYRAIGPFLDPSFNALILNLLFLIFFDYLLGLKKLNIVYLLCTVQFLFAIGLSFSRTAFLSLFLGLFSIIFTKKGISLKNKLAILSLLALFLVFVILLAPKPGGEGVNLLRTSSILAKVDSYKQILSLIKQNFWLGVGFNALRFFQKDFGFIPQYDWFSSNAAASTDNSFLFIFATTGIFGFLTFCLLWLSLPVIFLKKKSCDCNLILSVWVVITFSSLFFNALFYPWVMFIFLSLLAEFTASNLKPIQPGSRSKRGQYT